MIDSEAERLYGGRPPSEDQRAAIEAPLDGRRAIDAGAGTGKTTTLAYRALRLISSGRIRADQLLVVTFTRKAAAEIVERIVRALDGARDALADPEFDAGSVTCVTIHALATRVLAEFAYANGYEAPPRPLSDGEAHALFDDAVDEAFADAGASDALPVVELGLSELRPRLAGLAFTLHARGVGADEFETRALAAADALEAQPWGQLWKWSKTKAGARAYCDPKVERTADERREEAQCERRNVRWVASLLRNFDERLRSAHATTYGMLLTQTVRLVQDHPEVARTLRERWRYVLVDEFQDTTAMQLNFLRALFGDPDDPDRALRDAMVVGDFRQAIYGFNGADDRIMRAFADAAHGVYRLERNRRSHEQIVRAAHAALAQVGVVAGDDPVLEAVRGASDAPCVFVRKTDDALGRLTDRVAEEADAIAAEIARLWGEGVAPSDVALLLRKRTHAHRYVAALARRAIPVALDRRAGLLETPEIRDVRAWLRLAVDLDDPLALVRVLQSPQLGLTDAALARIARCAEIDAPARVRTGRTQRFVAAVLDGTYDTQLDEETQRRLKSLRGWIETLLPARGENAPLAVRRLFATVPIAASYATDAQAERRIANLRSFEALAQRFAAEAADARFSEFLRYLERSVDFDETIEEASLDAEGVAVMTVHQAKGLEWPVVFVAGAESGQYESRHSGNAVRYDERTGALVLTRDLHDRPTLRAAMEKKAYDDATGETLEIDERRERERCETGRIFYVALTRARDRLYVSSPSVKSAYAPLDALVPHAAPWPAPSPDEAAATTRVPPPTEAARRIPPSAKPRAWRPRVIAAEAPALPNLEIAPPRVSFTALATFETCPRRARYRYRLHLPEDLAGGLRFFPGSDAAERDGALDAAAFGRLVHAALQHWAQARIDGDPIAIDDALAAAVSQFSGVAQRDRERAAACVGRAAAALAGLQPLEAEAGFTHVVAGVELFGVIDLVARDERGALHVIDYKTGSLAADDHYALQLDLYARAARERFGGEPVRARLLRLSEAAAEFRDPKPPGAGALERLIHAAGTFSSDTAKPGGHCVGCPYNGAPCNAAGGVGR